MPETLFQNPSDKILMSKIRIFSYLPNPRVWKAVIAGKLCNVEVEVIGDKPKTFQTGSGIMMQEF